MGKPQGLRPAHLKIWPSHKFFILFIPSRVSNTLVTVMELMLDNTVLLTVFRLLHRCNTEGFFFAVHILDSLRETAEQQKDKKCHCMMSELSMVLMSDMAS